MTLNWTRPLLAASVGLLATLGCAEEREPINRVQPNALEKSFFVGADLQNDADNPSFYANGTVLDVGYGATQDALFDGFYSNDLSMIRWQITEDRLIGRLAYERVDGSDGMGAGLETNDGQVIYAFNIQGHFDIKRSYNPSTGEELNVVEENTSDAPWYQRKHFRVDWSRNLITEAYDFDTLAIYGVFFGAYSYEEVGYYVNDPDDENAPRFEDGYFDVTTKAWAKPATIDLGGLFGFNTIPACFLDADFSGGAAPAGNCNPAELTIRHSFWKVEDNDYEPTDWDGFRFQVAGAFTKDRYGFARNYGMVDTQWRRFISRYNIWQRSHYYTDPENMVGAVECYTPEKTPPGGNPTRDENRDGTDDECEAAGPGSQCDSFSQKCTLPYRDRAVRPIVWYYTNKSDHRYFEPTHWATQEWDIAIRVAVMAARHAECERLTVGKDADCDAEFPVPRSQIDELDDTVAVWREVDACRMNNGASDINRRWDTQACAGVAADTLAKRGYQAGTPEYRAIETVALMDDAVILCHSPIQADDHPLCAAGEKRLPAGVAAEDCQKVKTANDPDLTAACKAAYTVRIGDVRRHLVNVFNTPQTSAPWGFGPTYASPLTGEAISASINVWAWPTDFISQSVVDVARFIGGELSVADVTDGKFVKDWDQAAELAAKGGALPPMKKSEVESRKASMLRAIGRDINTGAIAQTPELHSLSHLTKADLQKVRDFTSIRAATGTTSAMKNTYFARMQGAYGSQTEAALINPAMQELAGATQLPTVAANEFASPLRGRINPTLYREIQQMKELGLAARGACMLEADAFAPSPTAMTGVARKLQAKFGNFDPNQSQAEQLERGARMADYLSKKMHFAVMAHEMGHTFGLRHNFVSSSNAFNYRPQYWQLRTKDGTVTNECTDLAEGDQAAGNCVGPRYYDPVTEEETEGMIGMWSHSSIMDYAGDYSQDFLGLGAYDYHATRMFYGDTVSVFADDDLKDGTPLAGAISETILDTFGGILGYQFQDAVADFPNDMNVVHYSQLNRAYRLIDNCQAVNPDDFRPANWDDAKQGLWDPTLDGQLVQVNGNYTRCKQRKLGYVSWDQLKGGGFDPGDATSQPTGGVGPSIDPEDRTRFPFGFATDSWADLGNLAVYRHDQGADAYELFEFLITEQELRHIFDNYRRNRQTFSVRSAANRVLSRYNTKMRDGAKGLALIYNNIQNLQPGAFSLYVDLFKWGDNMLASGLAFDHFTRQMQRPNVGVHAESSTLGITSVFSPLVADENAATGLMLVPDGAQGFWNSVGIGGKRVNNGLSSTRGEYDSQFTMNAGSYYDKVYTTMLMTESVDNFISSSLTDFTDARWRAVSLADLYPDGYRRWLANHLTGDAWVTGARVAATSSGRPDVDQDGYPAQPLGWISWWPDTPEVCFPNEGTMICSAYDKDGASFKPNAPAVMRALDPQVGWEQQKFLIAWTLVYLPENQKRRWLDQMGIWSLGADSDPGFQNRIELHMPTGEVYVARTYGSEEFCFGQTAAPASAPACKTVQRGIAARILEYANELLTAAYVTTPVTHNGVTWHVPDLDPVTGQPQLRTAGSCDSSAACLKLQDYGSIPSFVRQAMRDFGLADPSMKGIYGG